MFTLPLYNLFKSLEDIYLLDKTSIGIGKDLLDQLIVPIDKLKYNKLISIYSVTIPLSFLITVISSKRLLLSSPISSIISCNEINKSLLEEVNNKKYDLIVLNYANGDMVGHTGNYDAAVKAVETVDKCLYELYEKLHNEYTFLITADHGNCEKMLNEDGSINTAHTNNRVFFIVTDTSVKLKEGTLSDIAPTILDLMNIEKNKEMTGSSLIKR